MFIFHLHTLCIEYQFMDRRIYSKNYFHTQLIFYTCTKWVEVINKYLQNKNSDNISQGTRKPAVKLGTDTLSVNLILFLLL